MVSINFKSSWAEGMDGQTWVKRAIQNTAPQSGMGETIDSVLATACHNADGVDEFVCHLNYVISELTKVRNNALKDLK